MDYIYSIRKGDAITTSNGVGIVTKKTKNYYYYFFGGHVSRIKKTHLWLYLDEKSNDIGLKYSNQMKYRRKQKSLRTLDLHGTRHHKVSEKVRSFLNFVEFPCTIITGRSTVMKKIVEDIVEEYNLNISSLVHETDGKIIITE